MMQPHLFHAVAAITASAAPAPAPAGFGPAHQGQQIVNATIFAVPGLSLDECTQTCSLSHLNCVAITWNVSICTGSGWSGTFAAAPAAPQTAYYLRDRSINTSALQPAITYALTVRSDFTFFFLHLFRLLTHTRQQCHRINPFMFVHYSGSNTGREPPTWDTPRQRVWGQYKLFVAVRRRFSLVLVPEA